MHSKPYIALIGHAGDNHGISNREKDDMSRDPPLPRDLEGGRVLIIISKQSVHDGHRPKKKVARNSRIRDERAV